MMSATMHAQESQPVIRVMQLSTFASINLYGHNLSDFSIYLKDLDAAETLANDILAKVRQVREGLDADKCELVEAK